MSSHRGALRVHVALVYLFLYGPIAVLVGLSFNTSGLPTAWTGFSAQWYGELLHNEALLKSARNTIIVACASTLIATVLGTLLALGLDRLRRSPVLDAVVFAPMILPNIVLAIALLSFFTAIRMTLGLHSIVIAHAVFNIAFVCAIVHTRLSHFDHSMIEASIDLGASEATTFRRIVLPSIFPGILAGALVAFTLSFNEFIIAYVSRAPTSITFPVEIYSMIRVGVTPEINAVATIVLGVSFTLILLSQRLNRGTP